MTGLPVWDTIDPSLRTRRVSFVGSSTTEGTVGISNGGLPEEFRDLAESRWGRGGDGFIGCWHSQWSFTTGGNAWTLAGNSDGWDKGPMQDARTASGSGKVATFTAAVEGGFFIYVVDKAGSAQFSISIDGAAYVNMGTGFVGDNTLKRFGYYLPATTTVRVRAANAAGTSAQVTLLGIEPVSLASLQGDPGIVIDNAGKNSDFLVTATRYSGASLAEWLTLIGTDVCVCMFTNDLLFYDGSFATFWTGMLETALDACTTAGAELVVGIYFSRSSFELSNPTAQAEMRALTLAFGEANDVPVVDMQKYYATAADAFDAGLLQDESGNHTHPTVAGTQFMAQKFYRQIGRTGTEAMVRI